MRPSSGEQFSKGSIVDDIDRAVILGNPSDNVDTTDVLVPSRMKVCVITVLGCLCGDEERGFAGLDLDERMQKR